MTLPLSQLEGKYDILHKLKEGGMGAIYKVRHRLLDEVRVVKVMRPHVAADSRLRQRFQREAKIAIRFRHPNIAQLYDFSMDADGTAIMVMEFIDGVTLQDLLRSAGPPEVGLAVEIAVQGLEALGCLHHSGVVHRDISNDNLMLTESFDGRPLVKLIDLGIAKDPLGEATGTAVGTFLGKARYSAPEQFEGGGASLQPAADLYSFGVALYELLTGRLPIGGESFSEIATGHLMRPPVPFAVSDPEGRIPPGLREVVLAALAKKPAERIPTAESFIERLRPFRPAAVEPAELDGLLRRARAAAAPVEAWTGEGASQELLDEHFGAGPTPPPEREEDGEERRRSRWIDSSARQLESLLPPGRADARALEVLSLLDDARAGREHAAREGPEAVETIVTPPAAGAEPPGSDASAAELHAPAPAPTPAPVSPRRARPDRARRRAERHAAREGRAAEDGSRPAPDAGARRPAVVAAPRARRSPLLAIAGAAVLVAAGLGAWWALGSRGAAKPAGSDVSSLPEGGREEIVRKYEALRTLLSGADAAERGRLEDQLERIDHLLDLQRRLDSLTALRHKVEQGGGDEFSADEAGALWGTLHDGLENFDAAHPGDRTAARLRAEGLAELRRIQDGPASR